MDVSAIFAKAVGIEETDPAAALKLYEQILSIEPHAAANINAGTICYNAHKYPKAESYYRAALMMDPEYPLAYFDLGNVLDETGRVPEAITIYLTALNLDPDYADVHYNLALAYEKLNNPRKALKHWIAYTKADRQGPWNNHAKGRIQRILATNPLNLIRDNPKPRRTKRRAKLTLVKS